MKSTNIKFNITERNYLSISQTQWKVPIIPRVIFSQTSEQVAVMVVKNRIIWGTRRRHLEIKETFRYFLETKETFRYFLKVKKKSPCALKKIAVSRKNAALQAILIFFKSN